MKKNIIVGVVIVAVSLVAYVGLSVVKNGGEVGQSDREAQAVSQKGFKGLIPAAEFYQKIATEEYIVLDIRTSEEYLEQRIGDDALLVDFYASDFKEQLNQLDKNQKYLVHCRSGARSSKAVKIMEDLGFTEFYELERGVNSWNQSGLPTYRGEA